MSTAPRPRPKLMVVGDSLPQGCRGLSVTAAYAAQSWPARLAAAQGWEFVPPDFPRPVLYDLEAEVRRLDTLTLSADQLRFQNFVGRFRHNLAGWLVGARESQFPCFDNLALAGAEIHDLYTRTAATSDAVIAEVAPDGPASQIPLARVRDLHLAVNARFTLNPGGDPAFAGFTQLDWVRERRPETVVVQVGHNHGLYAVGGKAVAGPIDGGHPTHGSYWAQWERLAADLAGLPAEVARVVVVLLPKVGGVANLRPRGVERADGYAETYEPVVSASPAVLAGPALAEVDAAIRAANAKVREVVGAAGAAAGAAGRTVFVDLYALFEGQDFKNSLDDRRRVAVGGGVTVDNRYLDSAPNLPRPLGPGGRRLVAGGLQSIDGMHPSGCGYALLAAEVMAALGLPHDRPGLVARGFAEDTALAHTPGELDVLVRVLAVLRDLRRLNHFEAARESFLTDGLHLTDALRLMRSVFTR